MKPKSFWELHVISIELRKIVTYRVAFWVQFVMSVFAHVGVAYFLWKAIFDYKGITTLKGFSFNGLMFYYMMVPLVNRIALGNNVGNISKEIYDGSLTKYIVYPLSFFKYKYLEFIGTTLVFYLQLLFTTVLFILILGVPDDISFNLTSLIMGLIAVSLASTLAFFMNSAIEMIAFWADNVWSLLVMIRFSINLLGGAMIPLSLFPDKFLPVLNLLPFKYLASFPINSFCGRITVKEWIISIIAMLTWTGVFFVITKYVWNKGKYKYSGVEQK